MSIYNKTWLVGLIIRLVLKLVFRRDWQREIFLLRMENEILRRQVKKLQLTDNDRVFFVSFLRSCKEVLANIKIVRPETVLAWHRKIAKRRWDYSKRIVGDPKSVTKLNR